MLRQRLLFGSTMIVVLVALVIADGWLSAGLSSAPSFTTAFGAGFLLTLLVAALAVGGSYELSRLCRAGGYQPLAHWAAFISLLLVFAPWVQTLQHLLVSGGEDHGSLLSFSRQQVDAVLIADSS